MERSIGDFEVTRKKFERLLNIPPNDRKEEDLFELMRLTSEFKIFESFKMSKIHKELCKHINSRSLDRGEIIFKQGDEGDAYYFILRGCVDIYIYDIEENNGKTKLKYLTSVLAGNGFGELALLYDCPRTATAIPNTKTDLAVIKKRYYTRLVKDLHERELLSLIKFYYTITIFKKEPISNILKYCLRTNRKSLNSYEPFLLVGDFLNEYCIIQTGAIKCFVKIKVNKYIIEHACLMTEDDFVVYLKDLQKKPIAKIEKKEERIISDLYDNVEGRKFKKDDNEKIYEEVLDIMEFNERDMYGEFYAAKGRKIDVYFLAILPTEVITIKTDDLKNVNPELQETIIKYAKPIFDEDIAFRKLYSNLNWDKAKAGLLHSAVNKK